MLWTIGRSAGVTLLLSSSACASPVGDVTVLLDAEDSITAGLDPGTAGEDVVDGWTVRFSRYLVAIGEVQLRRTADGATARDARRWVADLAGLGPAGSALTEITAVEIGRWDWFTYSTAGAGGALRHPTASEADFAAMAEGGLTYLLQGTIAKPDGQSCPPAGTCRPAPEIAFRLGVPVDANFGPCQAEDGLPGVTVTEAGSTVSLSIHGDHIFFDRFPSGAEVVRRRAQWLADSDLNGDGEVTEDEVMSIDGADLFGSDTYSLSGAPFPIRTAWDFVRSQLATQGHFQGEGECPWEVAP